jgi:hypothetical protein
MQKPTKTSIEGSQLEDVIAETIADINSGGDPADFKLDVRIGTLRNRSVRWFVKAYHDVNKPELVKSAFEKCRAGPHFNFSHELVTSSAAIGALLELRDSDPALWAEISGGDSADFERLPEASAEDESPFPEGDDNDDDAVEEAGEGGLAEQMDPGEVDVPEPRRSSRLKAARGVGMK